MYVDKENKQWIDEATFEELFKKWKDTPIGGPIYECKPVNEYFLKRLKYETHVNQANFRCKLCQLVKYYEIGN